MKGKIFNIEKYRIHDGEGIRSAIFLKGCNLRCPWCCNPESQSFTTQTVIHKNLCTACLSCYRNCPQQAIYYIDNIVKTNQDLCNSCGRCVQFCPNSARQIYGKEVTVEEVMKEVLKDSVYYSRSGGGVTISGGEPLLQPEFTRAILQECKWEYIHTAVETAGYVPWEATWQALELADVILMDIKATNSETAAVFLPKNADADVMMSIKKENIRRLIENNKTIWFRCPIIPDYNDNERHIERVGDLAAECGVTHIDLLPFHQFGKNKYDALEKNYYLSELKPMRDEHLVPYYELLNKRGFEVSIGG